MQWDKHIRIKRQISTLVVASDHSLLKEILDEKQFKLKVYLIVPFNLAFS